MTMFFLDWIVQGLVVAVVATLVVRLVPAAAAAQRHAILWLAMGSVLALPWAQGLFIHAASSVAVVALPGSAADASMLTISAPPRWMPVAALCIWAVVALTSIVRLGLNLRALRGLADAARPLSPQREARFQQFIAARARSRDVRVCVSDRISGACAIGFIRPRIVLASDLVTALDDESLEGIVLHEYAHLQRFDDWTRLLQCAVLAVAGLHPAVRWISRQIDIEREVACDRLVVERTGAPLGYARSLAVAAEISGGTRGLTPVAAPGASMSGAGLHARVTRLLTGKPVSAPVAWIVSCAAVVVLSVSVAAAGVMPPVVSIASVEEQLEALASLPLGPGIMRELPNDVWSRPQGAAAERLGVPPRTRRGVVPAVRLAAMSQAVLPATARPVLAQEAEPVAASDGQPLAATALAPQVIAVQSSAPAVPAVAETQSPDVVGIAAKLGATTGIAAARAGTSIGRFFRNSGVAVAGRF